MKSKVVLRALLAGSAAVVIAGLNKEAGSPNSKTTATRQPTMETTVSDSLKGGRSGKLRGSLFTYLTHRPFTDKVNGRIGRYLIGFWPGERRRVTSLAYRNPRRFIEVTPENQDTRVSEHFRLRDFLTHDQARVWPKYVVLQEDLLDKLELVIQELERKGLVVRHMTVMSGFRTPQYNGGGGDGRSGMSRHMYGDAADVFVDNNRDGRMDDLNRDGRVDHRDARLILDAAERVERLHPELSGGVGVYRANRAHGPFAHIDVRGWRARWGLTG
ncbi:MAG: hypothetical protein ACREXY_24815 [Gammaproteobacteria bacterium]